MARLTPDEALQRLAYNGKRKAKGTGKMYSHVRTLGLADVALYVFRHGKHHYIVPADDRLIPLIADMEQADFTVDLPPCLNDWLGEYERELAWFDTMGDNIADVAVTDVGRHDVPFMLQTTWAQTSPYNANLTIGGKACKAGCTAVASAQVMFYWWQQRYRRGCTATEAYVTKTNRYKVAGLPPVASFDYANMTLGKPKEQPSKDAVAEIIEYCGKVMEAYYTPNGTGVPPAVMTEALKTHLRMGNGIKMIFASKGALAFEMSVYEELAHGRPVIMSGYHTSGGHAFVCDGYRTSDDKFHFNWGWGGSYNGWYAMSALNPTAANTYNSNKIATIGIKPDYVLGDVNGDGDVNVTDVMEISQQILGNKPQTEAADINSDGEVTVTDQQLLVKKILGK